MDISYSGPVVCVCIIWESMVRGLHIQGRLGKRSQRTSGDFWGEKLLKRERLHALKGVRDKGKAATSLLACYAQTLNTCLVSILGYRSSIEAVASRCRVTGVSEEIRVERQLGRLAGGRTRRRKSGRHVDKLALGHSRRRRAKQKGRQGKE